MRWRRTIGCCLLLMAWMVTNGVAADLNVLKSGVVKIIANSSEGGRKVGAGFIVRLEPEIVYMVTAAHVVEGDPQPDIVFFTKQPKVSVKGAVMSGAEWSDLERGRALIVVRGKNNIPDGLQVVPFQSTSELASGGEEVLVIGHPTGGGDWAVLTREVTNRVGPDIKIDGLVASRFSGGPMFLDGKVVGMMMSTSREFGSGITHKRILNYMEELGVIAQIAPIVQKDATKTRKWSARSNNSGLGSTRLDGMVLVSAGEFTMGSKGGFLGLGSEGNEDEHPQHQVYLDEYYLDQYEVTKSDYHKFMQATSPDKLKDWAQVNLSRDGRKPVVKVSWHDADAYCKWAGKRLPTEAEWEKAARGTDGQTYPWGDSKPTSNRANFNQDLDSEVVYAQKLKAVGSYEQGKSPYGVYDMAGNVWEWVADWFSTDYYSKSPKRNPQGPSSGLYRVIRGGSWNDSPSTLRSAIRSFGDPLDRVNYIGVRCAQDAP